MGIPSSLREGYKVPSFYAPFLLYVEHPPFGEINLPEDMVTAVLVPLTEDKRPRIIKNLKHLEKSRLDFLRLRFKDTQIDVVINQEGNDPFQIPPYGDDPSVATSSLRNKDLAEDAKEAGLDLKEPSAAVLWSVDKDPEKKYQVYSYLPTKIESCFDVDIHGDFQLSLDRNHLDIAGIDQQKKEATCRGRYNRDLVILAAQAHMGLALSCLKLDSEKEFQDLKQAEIKADNPEEFRQELLPNFWKKLIPYALESKQTTVTSVFTRKLQDLLFPGIDGEIDGEIDYSKWATLAEYYFGTKKEPKKRRIESFNQFWEATNNWLGIIVHHKSLKQGWKDQASELIKALRDAEVLVIPVTDGHESSDSWVPADRFTDHAGGETQKGVLAKRIIFIPSTDSGSNEDEKVESRFPKIILDHGVAITHYRFPGDFSNIGDRKVRKVLGLSSYSRPDVLSRLRQLPWSVSDYNPNDLAKISPEKQSDILSFVLSIYLDKPESGGVSFVSSGESEYLPAWRCKAETRERDAGSAISTLFLPTIKKEWEPARQLSMDKVDFTNILFDELRDCIERAKLEEPLENTLKKFLYFLSVFPAPPDPLLRPLLLIEEGEKGLVRARQNPPALIPIRRKPSQRDSEFMLYPCSEEVNPEAFARSLESAWNDDCPWLKQIITSKIERNKDKQVDTRKVRKDDTSSYTDVMQLMTDKPWFPVETRSKENSNSKTVKMPVLLSKSNKTVCPKDIVIFRSKGDVGRRNLFYHIVDNDQTRNIVEILERLGAIRSEHLDERYIKEHHEWGVHWLQDFLPNYQLDKLQDEFSSARNPLIEFFQLVIDAFAKEKGEEEDKEISKLNLQELRLLCYAETKVGCSLRERKISIEKSDKAWITNTPLNRELIASHFKQLNLITATVGEKNVKWLPWLQERWITLETSTKQEEKSQHQSRDLRDTLTRTLPYCLALAMRTLDHPIEDDTLRQSWNTTTLERDKDTYIVYTLKRLGSKTSPEKPVVWRKNEFDDVFLFSSADRKTLYYDVRQQHRDEPESYPPLQNFAKPLAQLFKLESSSSQFFEVLAMVDGTLKDDSDRRLDDTLEEIADRHSARPESNRLKKIFQPLNNKERERVSKAILEGLKPIELQLEEKDLEEITIISKKDLIEPEGGWGEITHDQILESLKKAFEPLPPQLKSYLPRLRILDNHIQDFRNRFSSIESTIISVVQEQDNTLDDHIRSAGERLDFDARACLFSWLREKGVQVRKYDTDEELIKAITEKEQYGQFLPGPEAKEANIRLRGRTNGNSGDGRRKYSSTRNQADRARQDRAKDKAGKQAEKVFLDYKVLDETLDVLKRSEERDEHWQRLKQAVNSSDDATKALDKTIETFKQLITAKTTSELNISEYRKTLRDSLYVAKHSDEFGFDILGLKEDNDGIVVVGYEIKSLKDPKSRDVFLTRNEIETWRATLQEGYNSESYPYIDRWELWLVIGGKAPTPVTYKLSDIKEEPIIIHNDINIEEFRMKVIVDENE